MKILHTADLHVGCSTHGKDDPTRGINSRWIDFEKCLEFMVDYGIKENIDLFLCCGDAYYDSSPSPTEQDIFARQIRKLFDKKIPVVMLAGNHDISGSFGKASSVRIFGNLIDGARIVEKPTSFDLETKSGKIRIVALPWAHKHNLMVKDEFSNLPFPQIREKMTEIYSGYIQAEAERIAEEKIDFPAILALHAHIDGATVTEGSERRLFESDITLPLSVVARREFSYVALGHFHRHQDLNEGSAPPVVYSGSIERISFSEVDQKKGFVMVEIDGRKQATYKHIETPARKMLAFEFDARNETDPMRKIRAEIETKKADIDDAIVRARIRCKAEQRNQINSKDLRNLFENAFLVSELKIIAEEDVAKAPLNPDALREDKILETYIDNNPELKPKRDELLALAKELEQELLSEDAR